RYLHSFPTRRSSDLWINIRSKRCGSCHTETYLPQHQTYFLFIVNALMFAVLVNAPVNVVDERLGARLKSRKRVFDVDKVKILMRSEEHTSELQSPDH